MFYTIEQIKRANGRAGGYWFDPDTMRFFSTRVMSRVFPVPGGALFVTSDRHPAGMGRWIRRYSVRRADGTGQISTVGDFGGYPTRAQALRAVQNLARLENE